MKILEKKIRISLFELELAAWLKRFPEFSTEERISLSEDDGRRNSVLSEFALSEVTGEWSVLLAVEKTGNTGEFLITYSDDEGFETIIDRNYPPLKKELDLYKVVNITEE